MYILIKVIQVKKSINLLQFILVIWLNLYQSLFTYFEIYIKLFYNSKSDLEEIANIQNYDDIFFLNMYRIWRREITLFFTHFD